MLGGEAAMRTCLLIVLAGGFLLGVGRAVDGVATESEKLAGTWIALSAVDYGEPIPQDQAKELRLVFTGADFTAFHGDKSVMQGSFTIDPAKKPRSIDLNSNSGRHEGKTLKGLYEWDGDTLRICFVEPGEQRPKEVASTLESGAFLLVCKRQKP